MKPTLLLLASLLLISCQPGGGTSSDSSDVSSEALRGGKKNNPPPAPAPAPTTGTPVVQGASGRIFYIDFLSGLDSNNGTSKTTPWKLAPGMTGFSGSYSPLAGDTFVFKGGVRWTSGFPWNPRAGAAGKPNIHTVDLSWFNGTAFSKPTFDNLGRFSQILNHPGPGYLHFDNLSFLNCAKPYEYNQLVCLGFNNSTNVNFTNNYFKTESWLAISFGFQQSNAAIYENYRWTGNEFTGCSSAIWFSSASPNTTMRNIVYSRNVFHNFQSQIGGLPGAADGIHGDGAFHGFSAPPFNDPTQIVENFEFCSNRFYGSFSRGYGSVGGTTAMFFHQGAIKNLLICNNEFGFRDSGGLQFHGSVVLASNNNPSADLVQIYNNNFYGTDLSHSATIDVSGFKRLKVKNNIFSAPRWFLFYDGTDRANFESDYNVLEWSAYIGYHDQWYDSGYDANSQQDMSPKWVDGANGNFALQPDSPALGRGVNLTGLNIPQLSTDISGAPRPVTGAWTIGARNR